MPRGQLLCLPNIIDAYLYLHIDTDTNVKKEKDRKNFNFSAAEKNSDKYVQEKISVVMWSTGRPEGD